MKRILSREIRNPNYGTYVVCHLECGHTRTFDSRQAPQKSTCLCWVCETNEPQTQNGREHKNVHDSR